jgi:rare lipoprotein A
MHAGWTTTLLLLALGACATPKVQTAAPSPPCVQEGMASWYTPQASPNPTADGETHGAAAALTAAHLTLPFGTQVLVTDLETGRSVVVRINDRGPHDRGRIIDLSTAAAKALNMRQDGVTRVRLEIYHPGGPTATPAVATTDAACLLPHTIGS